MTLEPPRSSPFGGTNLVPPSSRFEPAGTGGLGDFDELTFFTFSIFALIIPWEGKTQQQKMGQVGLIAVLLKFVPFKRDRTVIAHFGFPTQIFGPIAP